jgi:hypothetical protein
MALVIIGSLSGLALGQNKVTPAFTLRLPWNVNPEAVRIDVDVRGKSNWWTQLATRKGTFEYAIPFRYGNSAKAFEVGDAQSLSLFIYTPGYLAIRQEFQKTELASLREYEVVLERQRTTVLLGLLIDAERHLLAEQTIHLNFDPGCDSPDCIGNPMEIARTQSGIDGTFQFDVPSVGSDDAMFHMRLYGTTFSLTSDTGILLSPESATQKAAAFSSFNIGPEMDYPARKTVMRIVPGRISGKIGPLFLKQNKLPENLNNYFKDRSGSIGVALEVDGVAGVFVRLSGDGSFVIPVLPGTYGLSLHIARGKTPIDIRIAEGIVIAEGQEKVINLP